MILCYLTGTPGTGKSTVANILADRVHASVIEINDLIIKEGHFWGYDIHRDSLIIDEGRLFVSITERVEEKENHILVGLPMDLRGLSLLSIIVLRCDIATLRRRLVPRGYSSEKVEENIQSEIMGIILDQMVSWFPNTPILEIDTTYRSPEETVTTIENFTKKLI